MANDAVDQARTTNARSANCPAFKNFWLSLATMTASLVFHQGLRPTMGVWRGFGVRCRP
jgi:hypothetical protein